MRNDIDMDDFKKRLEERLKIIVDGQKAIAPVELDPARVGRISRMDAMQQQAMSQAARRILEIEHQRILKALSRMKTGDYGYCMMCDEEIPAGRLQVDPSALTCVTCAQAAENQ